MEVLWKIQILFPKGPFVTVHVIALDSLTSKAVKPFPTMYCNEIKHKYLSTPKKLMQMLGPADNISADEAFRTYVRPIWNTGNLPFTDSWQWRVFRVEAQISYCCSYCFFPPYSPDSFCDGVFLFLIQEMLGAMVGSLVLVLD